MNNVKAEGKESIVDCTATVPRAPSINPGDRLFKSLKNNRYRILNTETLLYRAKSYI